MNVHPRNFVRIVTALCVGALLLTGIAMGKDAPVSATDPNDASLIEASAMAKGSANATTNDYITQLAYLHALGESASAHGQAVPATSGIYEFASDLDRLNAMSSARNVRPTANDYITTLDQLRNLGAR